MSLLLAGIVFCATCIATAVIGLANLEAPNGKSLAMSPMPIFVIGCLISGMLFVGHWFR